jgi:transcriptional regulator with XRE-family HTH domain
MAEIDGGKLHATRAEWLRLAAVVTASRKRAGYSSMATLARAGRMSTSTVSSIERAASDAYWTQSIDKLEDALSWRRGASKDVLEAEGLDPHDQDAVDELVLPKRATQDLREEQPSRGPMAAYGRLTPENQRLVDDVITNALRAQGLNPDDPHID